MKESNVLKKVLMRFSKLGSKMFRINVGKAWTGNKIIKLSPHHPAWPGAIVIEDPRPFKTGVPKGFSDTVGWTERTVTPDMLGQKVAIFTVGEVKNEKGRATKEQVNFLNRVAGAGGIAGIVRSEDDVDQLLSDSAASPARAK